MNGLVDKTIKFIYSKKKQIFFALFALICIILDQDSSSGLLKAAAPAVVAAAVASGGGAVAGGGTAAAAGSAAAAAASGGGAAAGGGTAAAAGSAATSSSAATATSGSVASGATATSGASSGAVASKSTSSMVNNNFPTNSSVPKNTNPNAFKSDTLSSNTVSDKKILSTPEGLDESTSKASQKASSMSDVEKDKNNSKKNRMNPELNKDADKDDDEEYDDFDNASEEAIDLFKSRMVIGCIIFGPFLAIFLIFPAIILSIVNPTNTSISNIDCDKLVGNICIESEDDASIWNKLENLFKYGRYGSNSEVVVEEIEDSYDKIKEEYDFIISLPLLTSSLFSDEEYVESNSSNGSIEITEDMMDRVQYIYDMAFLQLIPRFHIYNCESHEDQYGNVSYTQSYQYSTEEEDEVINIPTGVCGEDISGGIFKEIEYFFDEEKYFKRLMDSEELDLVYKYYNDADKLLVNKIRNQYYIYKNIYKVEDEAIYANVPIHLEHDESINLSTPLKGRYSITSPFGMRTGEYAGMHNGIDLVSSDKNIYAAGSGIVTRSNVETEGGNVIEITHTDSSGRKYVTQYAHLSERHVSVGDVINSGDVIGIMGSTGTMASGVHLHFSMWDKETGNYYNPRKLFNEASNY